MTITEPPVVRSTVLPFDVLDAQDRRRRNDTTFRLLHEWEADESGYDEVTWPELQEALDHERRQIGARPLFPHGESAAPR